MTLASYNKRYEDILHQDISQTKKDRMLSDLMTELEQEYHIPAISSKEYEKEHKSVIALYRKISVSREL